MANATFEDHPTDPNKVILRKKPYLDKGADYEHGFIDGMQHQMQSSVDKADDYRQYTDEQRVVMACRLMAEAQYCHLQTYLRYMHDKAKGESLNGRNEAIRIIKEMRPAIVAMDGNGVGKTTEQWLDEIVKQIEKNT